MNKSVEAVILSALLKTVIEQKGFLKDQLKQRPKQLFNTWEKQGFALIDSLEGKDENFDEQIEAIADVLHEAISDIREQITP